MAEHPLADSFLLVDRAEREIYALAGKLNEFMDSDPYRLIIKPYPAENECRVVPEFSRKPDPEWKIDYGVIANHLRSALDYIPAYLANPADPDVSHTQFPIFTRESDYLTRRKGKRSGRDKSLQGVPKKFLGLFDNQQPYARGEDPETGPLNVMVWVTNAHKHRQLQAALVSTRNQSLVIIVDGKPWLNVTIEAGQPLMPEASCDHYLLRFTPPPVKDELRLEYRLETRVAFGKREASVDDLAPSIVRVREILEVFKAVI